MTMSKMSMNKKSTSDSKTEDENNSKSIWPSFFKMTDNVDHGKPANGGDETSSKFTSSVAGQSATSDVAAARLIHS